MHNTTLNTVPGNAIISALKEINFDFDNSFVIDAGCGNNVYKDVFSNVIGFDKNNHNDKPDIVCDFLSAPFEKECADLVLVLGSNQYRSLNLVKENYKKAWSWVKPGGYLVSRYSIDNETWQDLKHIITIRQPSLVPITDDWMENLENELNVEKLFENKVRWFMKLDPLKEQLKEHNINESVLEGLQKTLRIWKKNV